MRTRSLPLAQTGQMHPLTADYLNGDPALRPYYSFSPDLEGIEEAIDMRGKFYVERAEVCTCLIKQYTALDPAFMEKESLVLSNIQALDTDGVSAFTVTTGHQLVLFGGPLYFIYKIASCIAYCKALSAKFPQYKFIPVLWLASEDHDFEEISTVHAFGKELRWQREAGGAVGRLTLEGLAPLMHTLTEVLGSRPEAADLLKLLQESYGTQPTLSLATRAFVHGLFGHEGLVILDAYDASLKVDFWSVMKQDLFSRDIFERCKSTTEELGKKYSLPVNPRESNVFYISEGKRERIIKEGYGFNVGSVKWTEEDLWSAFETHPENFSPNVVLRPMYQETILPNLAYIGGTNEIAYWLQLKAAFEAAGVFFPQLMVRDSALWVGKKLGKDMEKLNVSAEDFLSGYEGAEKAFYQKNELTHPAETKLDAMAASYYDLRESLQGLPPAVVGPIVKGLNEQVGMLKKFKKEIRKAKEESEAANLEKLRKIYSSLFPNATFQERRDNFMPLYLQYGEAFFTQLLENFNPAEKKLSIFQDE